MGEVVGLVATVGRWGEMECSEAVVGMEVSMARAAGIEVVGWRAAVEETAEVH